MSPPLGSEVSLARNLAHEVDDLAKRCHFVAALELFVGTQHDQALLACSQEMS